MNTTMQTRDRIVEKEKGVVFASSATKRERGRRRRACKKLQKMFFVKRNKRPVLDPGFRKVGRNSATGSGKYVF